MPPRASMRSWASVSRCGPALDFIVHRSLIWSPMRDPYEILGVQKTDSDAAIRSAYRKLAKRHHPDVNPGKPEAAERFKEISAAYDILGDKDKRARYDRGEIDAAGNEVPPQRPFYRDFGDATGREKYRADAGFDPEDLESIFGQAFGDEPAWQGDDVSRCAARMPTTSSRS